MKISPLKRRSPLLPRSSKFNARPTTVLVDGIKRTYPSQLEADTAKMLRQLLKDGLITKLQEQYPLKFEVNGVMICRHYPDFYIELPSGKKKFVEAKGVKTPTFNIKHRLTLALFPEIDYLINPTISQVLR